jgi:molecular chaperone HtpG
MDKFEGKSLKSITRSNSGLDAIKDEKNKDKADEKAEESPVLDQLIAAIKLQLGEDVKDVRVSKRLTGSPVCLVADEDDMDVNLERMLRKQGQLKGPMPRVLEINPDHIIITKLAARAKKGAADDDGLMKDAAYLLLDQAHIADGEVPSDLAAFGKRLASVMEHAL